MTSDHRRNWIHFAFSAASMLLLAVFTVWRASVTAWRPNPDRFYFFPNSTWIGSIDHEWLSDFLRRVDHGWFNDFLLGPGTVACFFVVFTTLYAAGGLFREDSGYIFRSTSVARSDSSWADHKRLMRIILYGLLVRALIEGWGEEVGIFASPFIFDPWDLTVELGGIVFGSWLVHTLSYPLFSRVPHFAPEGPPDIPSFSDLRSKLGIDAMSVIATGLYIFIVDPFELRPLTLVERQTLCVEVAIVFIAFRAALNRGMNPSSDSIPCTVGAVYHPPEIDHQPRLRASHRLRGAIF
jgi:hypothetical protein